MSLSEIKNRLYKKNADDDLMSHDESEFDARVSSVGVEKAMPIATDDEWIKEESYTTKKKKKIFKILVISLGMIFSIAVALVVVYQIRKSSFNEVRVSVTVEGPVEAKSGKLLTYEIPYNNDNWGSLKNVVLRINHPESFKPEESTQYQEESPTVSLVKLGDLLGHASGKIIFSGKAYAPKGTLMYLKADLSYVPANFNSQFSANAQLGINVVSTPITIEVAAPQNLANGDALDYQIVYKNTGEDDFENIRIEVVYQDGFTFAKASRLPAESNNIWYIGHLAAGEEGNIVISGKLQGEEGNIKKFNASIGTISQEQFISYNEEQVSTKIVSSPLAISQTVNGVSEFIANAGETLVFEIQYKNNSEAGLRDVIVKEFIDSPVLDYSTLDMDGGVFNMEAKTIEWKASDYPILANLAAGQTGKIRFSIQVKNIIPIETTKDKNFVISSIAKIDSPDIATPLEMNKIIAGNRIDVKLRSKLIVAFEGYHTDQSIENYGPIPPTVGQETSYTIHLKIGNVSNDITDAKVEIILPTNVVATGKIYPENTALQYNERTNNLIWSVGDMQVGEGVISPLREVTFQVKVTPAPNQVGEEMDIMKSAVFSAKDSFTGEDLVAKLENKTTMLREDETISPTGWKVIQ